tara:strand:- start:72 stop:509 length:438 start_codon:yes stop_codon:yes gene_type:complete
MKQLIAGQENIISFPLIKERVGLYSVHLYQNVGDEEVEFNNLQDLSVSIQYNYSNLHYEPLSYSTEGIGAVDSCCHTFVSLLLPSGAIVHGGEYSLIVHDNSDTDNIFFRGLAEVVSSYNLSDPQSSGYLEPEESNSIYSNSKIL